MELADVVTSPPLAHPDGYLYLGDLSGHLVAVDARTGEVAGSVPYSQGSPLLVGAAGPDRILMSSARVLTMIDPDGREVWAAQAGGGEPLVVDGRVLVSAGLGDGRVYALDASDGAVLWEFNVDQSVTDVAYGDGVAVVHDGDGTLYGIDIESGRRLWIQHPSTELDRVARESLSSETVVHSGRVYVGSASGNLLAFDLATGDMLWDLPAEDPPRFGLAAHTSTVVFSDGDSLRAASARTGQEFWTTSLPGPVGPPAVLQDRVLVSATVPSDRHDLAYDTVLIAMALDDGRELARVSIEGFSEHTPIVNNGTAYVVAQRGDTVDQPRTFRLVAVD